MAKKIWIKLYLELLNDAKMARLQNWLWRRAIEFFLLAGEIWDDGYLPTVEEMVWRLRINEEDLGKSLQALSAIGVVNETPGGWMVTHFKERQTAKSTLRIRSYRERNRSETDGLKRRIGNVTAAAASLKRSGSVSSSSSVSAAASDSYSNSNSASSSPVTEPVTEKAYLFQREALLQTPIPGGALTLYAGKFSKPTPVTTEIIKEMVEKYGDADVCEAMMEALRYRAANLNYVSAVLKRWYGET